MKKETENKKTGGAEKVNKKNEFLNLLETKLYDLGKNVLKSGISSLAISQINNTEEKIRGELEKKYKKYQSRIFGALALAVAVSFLAYGILEFILRKLEIENFTNIIFGAIFLGVYFILKSKK